MLTDLLKLQADMLTARGELAVGIASSWLLNRVSPNGGGNRPVLTLPGFLASGRTLLRLNRFLNNHGFEAQSWGLGRNLGPQGGRWGQQLDQLDEVLGDTVRKLADKHAAPVALIGQSLGGVYARELALQMPEEIDRVIMLGSPTFHPYLKAHHNRVIKQFGSWMNRQSHAELAGRSGLLHWDADRPALPCVAIHSPLDGVVDEASSVIPHYIIDQGDRDRHREKISGCFRRISAWRSIPQSCSPSPTDWSRIVKTGNHLTRINIFPATCIGRFPCSIHRKPTTPALPTSML